MSARRAWARIQARLALGGESGFTVFEVLVASIILVAGALATFQVFDTATRNTFRAEQTQVANDIAQRELEKLRVFDYKHLAMTAYPAYAANPNNPSSRVLGTDFALEPDGSNPAPMVVQGSALDSGGQVAAGFSPSTLVDPGPTPFTNGDVKGSIYRYVVWQNDPSCTTCGGNQDLKRIVVAVTLDTVASSTQRAYVETQSDVIDPSDTRLTEKNLPDGGPLTAEQFYMSDTPCASSGTTTRQTISADHLLHNTLGQCADGARTGTTPGAPDALLGDVPPDPYPDDPLLPDTFDYADDSYLEPTPDFDDGLQMLRQAANGCNYTPTGTHPEAKIHRWVSDPMPVAYDMTGHATLEINSKTINGAAQTGRICIYLFARDTDPTTGVVTDTRLVDEGTPANAYWAYQPPGNWAAGGWGTYRVGLNFPRTTIATGQRLGLAISVDPAGSPGDLQFLYDNPQFDSRLEVDTTTPLGG